MSVQAELKHAQEKLSRAIDAARKIGDDLRKFPARRSELQIKFDKSMVDVRAYKTDMQRLELEVEMATPVDRPIVVTSPEQDHGVPDEAHRAIFEAFIHCGSQENSHTRMIEAAEKHGAGPDEVHALLSGDDSLGGFTVPEDFRQEILRAVAGNAAVRLAGARVVQTSGPAAVWPTINEASVNPKMYTSTLLQGDGNWKGEAYVTGGTAPTVQNNPTFGMERVPVHAWSPDVIEIPQELLQDSVGNLESALSSLISEVFSLDQDLAFLLGDGVGKPEGIASDDRVSTVVVGDASTYATPVAGDNGISYPRMVNIWTDLAAQYRRNSTWLMNSDTFGLILKLEDNDSRPIFPVNQLPGQLFSRPMVMTEFLSNADNIANKPVILGDFNTAFVIAERMELRLQRLVERYAPNIGILPFARLGGQTVRPSALRVGTVQA